METRLLGNSGLQVSVLALGTMSFAGKEGSPRIGTTDVDEARTMVDMCLDAGVNLFDTANTYAQGRSEEVLGQAIKGKRDRLLVATKVFGRMGDGPNDRGLSRAHIIKACEDSLRRLNTDYIDLYQAHGFDAFTPLDETLSAFDDLIRAGKVRYIGCSNYSAWHLMKALWTSEKYLLPRYVSHQVYYSLVGRELEYELVPLSLDQNVGILVWSPLAAGFLTGKFRRGQEGPSEVHRWSWDSDPAMQMSQDQAYDVVETVIDIAQQRGVTPTQVSLNWLLRKPGVTSVIFGARNPQQLQDNLQAATWRLTDEEMDRLDAVSELKPPYPYWHQRKYAYPRNPGIPSKR
ncbi:MAG: aldo/keto reductase [Chloroflexota bacterium]|nr:MAG: aldo/keto reductase [Chloroflexota bacterium]